MSPGYELGRGSRGEGSWPPRPRLSTLQFYKTGP